MRPFADIALICADMPMDLGPFAGDEFAPSRLFVSSDWFSIEFAVLNIIVVVVEVVFCVVVAIVFIVVDAIVEFVMLFDDMLELLIDEVDFAVLMLVLVVEDVEVVAHVTLVALNSIVVVVVEIDVVAHDTFVAFRVVLVTWNIAAASAWNSDMMGLASSVSATFGDMSCCWNIMELPSRASTTNNSGNTTATCLTLILLPDFL
jgi:hypothetical protein